MGTYTTNLNLYNTNMSTDGNDTFDFQRDINDNNDKIDSAIGKLSNLTTTAKDNLVSAVNEVNSKNFANNNLSNLTSAGNARLQYAPFAINSGNVDSNGENNTLTFSGSTVTCAPCTVTTVDGKTYSSTSSMTWSAINTTGTAFLFFNTNSTSIGLLWGLEFSKVAPTNPTNFGAWVDTSKFPATLQYYNNGNWQTANGLVFLGTVTLSSGTITAVKNRKFNDSGYMIERYPEAVIVETYSNGDDWYRIYSDGWCEQGGKLGTDIARNTEAEISLIKSYPSTNYFTYVSMTYTSGTITGGSPSYLIAPKSASKITICNDGYSGSDIGAFWVARGYLA